MISIIVVFIFMTFAENEYFNRTMFRYIELYDAIVGQDGSSIHSYRARVITWESHMTQNLTDIMWGVGFVGILDNGYFKIIVENGIISLFAFLILMIYLINITFKSHNKIYVIMIIAFMINLITADMVYNTQIVNLILIIVAITLYSNHKDKIGSAELVSR